MVSVRRLLGLRPAPEFEQWLSTTLRPDVWQLTGLGELSGAVALTSAVPRP